MSALTPEEKKRLAGKCEELSSLFAEGRGPRVTNHGGWHDCAAGLLALAAGIDDFRVYGIAFRIDDLAFYSALTDATDEAEHNGNPCALAVVYLATRDALLEAE